MNKKNIKQLIRKNGLKIKGLGVTKIGLFGSYVRGEQKKASDIDIFIDFRPEEENFDNLMGLYDLLEDIFQGNQVDVVTLNGLSPYIGPKILNEVEYVEIND
ncbi:MAG: nucleotidyltransferase family protein [Phaeodactylibacter sp.]|nr:nucleotidyltransferase family protein [Phaeodactylibacter sp.]